MIYRSMGRISFDTIVPEDGHQHLEGCFKLYGGDWRVFYLTNFRESRLWTGAPIVLASATFRSGITGVDGTYPATVILNKHNAKQLLSEALGVTKWFEVRGPDSLQLK